MSIVGNILIVDDNPKFLSDTLPMYGFDTTVAVDGVQALQILSKEEKAFENTLNKKGTSVVEVVSTCNSGWKMTPEASNDWMVENMFPEYPLGDLKNI